MKDIAVLYADDDPPSRMVVQVTLTRRMKLSRVTLLEDSANFLEKVQAFKPGYDLVLLDIHMKPYTGFQMLAMLRGLPAYATTPIVALTASVMNEEVRQLEAAGFHSVVAKPIDVDRFPEIIERIMQGERIWTIVE
ncbi:MAG: response regulator [Anaerolineae bacterium]|nr:response regulator [Anaerolineae bacterium]NUQ06591.1 response regulator [Anaerolineae bacterium]